MTTREPFEFDEDPIVDFFHGYAINIPLIQQGFSSYEMVPQDILKSIMEGRKHFGISIIDFPESSE